MLAACAGVFLAPLLAPGTAAAREWIVTIGASLGASPPYEGAGYDLFLPSATFNVRPADRPYRFTPPDGGSTLALIATRFIDFGPMLRLRYERSDTGRLQGLDKVDIAAEPGVFLNVWPTNWLRARVEARYGLNAYEGPVGDAALDIIHTGRRWDFSLGPRYGYGGTRYMDTYFGVTPEEAEHSVLIRGPYEPGAGSRYTGLEVAASYHITNRLRTTYGFGWHRLSNLAADSPVVKVAGSPNDYQGTFGVSYSFGVNIGKKREAP
jgi:outer membrane scaffolding protein for murein synthesis (MipA/OmpV family)